MSGRGRRGREMGGRGALSWLPGPQTPFLGRGSVSRAPSPPTVHIPPTPYMTDMDRNREEEAWMGTVTMICPGKKFGFLKTDTALPRDYTGGSLFFHFDVVKNFLGKVSDLTHGSKVKFILYKAKDGDRATLEKPKAFAVYLTEQPTVVGKPGSHPGSIPGDRSRLTTAEDAEDVRTNLVSANPAVHDRHPPQRHLQVAVPAQEPVASKKSRDSKSKAEEAEKQKNKSSVSTSGKDIKSKLASGNKQMKVCYRPQTLSTVIE